MATSPPATLRCEQPKRGIACPIKRASFSVPSLLNTAAQDGKRVRIGFGKDPGQAGKSQALHLVRALSGFTAVPAAESGDKTTRFGPFSSQCRVGNVNILRGLWNDDLFRVLGVFPDLTHDDEVDACSGALEMLNPDMKGYGMFEFYRKAAGLDDYGAQLGDAAATSVVEVHKGKAGPGHRVLQERDRRCRRQAMLAAQMQKSADKAVAAVSIVIGATRPVAVAGKKVEH